MTRDDPLQALLDDPLREQLVAALAPGHCYLVGGAVRDRLALGRSGPDWDLIVEGSARDAAGRLARRLSGRLVQMGANRLATFRVVLVDRVLDVCDRHGTSLGAELARRDLTINSIALDLTTGETIDPVGGLADIDSRTLRANAPERFVEDPVRTLRLVRFALDLPQFNVEPKTTAAARAGVPLLGDVAPERVRAELDLVLGRPPQRALGDLLAVHGLFPALWDPESRTDSPNRLREVIDSAAGRLSAILDGGGELPARADLVAMQHALLLPIAGSSPLLLLDRLVGRGWITRAVTEIARLLLAPTELPGDEEAMRLFIDRFGPRWGLAAVLATGGSSADLTQLVSLAVSEGSAIQATVPLLDGHELEREFGLTPGPQMGELLNSLRREQVKGVVRTVEEARRWIATRLAQQSARGPTCRPGSAGSTP